MELQWKFLEQIPLEFSILQKDQNPFFFLPYLSPPKNEPVSLLVAGGNSYFVCIFKMNRARLKCAIFKIAAGEKKKHLSLSYIFNKSWLLAMHPTYSWLHIETVIRSTFEESCRIEFVDFQSSFDFYWSFFAGGSPGSSHIHLKGRFSNSAFRRWNNAWKR